MQNGRLTRKKKIRRPKKQLGRILLDSGLVDAAQLDKALERQRHQPGRLGDHLVSLGMITEDDLAKALSIQHRVPPFIPSMSEIDPEAVRMVPKDLARDRRVLPVSWNPATGVLQVALADPQDLSVADDIRFAIGARRVVTLVCSDAVWERLYAVHYEGALPETDALPEVSLELGAPAGPTPQRQEKSRRGRVLVADPSARRRRALAALWEGAGYAVERPRSAEEAAAAAAAGSWHAVWVHRDWSDAVSAPSRVVYGDPLQGIAARERAEAVGEEAGALAVEAGKAALGTRFPAVREAVDRVRLLATRQGIGGLDLRLLELRAWRAGLAGWTDRPGDDRAPGDAVLRAVAAYERALLTGLDRRGAMEAVRTDPSLDPEVVTSLVRWLTGSDLLGRLGARPRLLAVVDDAAGPLLDHLERNGWEVEVRDAPGDPTGFHAVLAQLSAALELLEDGNRPDLPPVFLWADASSADAMYALRLGAEDVFPPGTHPDLVATKLERATARQRPAHEGHVTGKLEDMGLADMVQILSNGLKTAVIHIESPAGRAEVALEQGDIVDATAPGLEGAEALYALVAWTEGVFRIVPGSTGRRRTIVGSTEGLLMEGFRRLDEARRDASEQVPELA